MMTSVVVHVLPFLNDIRKVLSNLDCKLAIPSIAQTLWAGREETEMPTHSPSKDQSLHSNCTESDNENAEAWAAERKEVRCNVQSRRTG